MARSNTPQIFEHHLAALHQTNPTAAAYLRNIPQQFGVAAFIPGRRYRQDTSNSIELMNSDFKVLRELPIVDLLQALWHKVLNLRYERQQQLNTYIEHQSSMHTA